MSDGPTGAEIIREFLKNSPFVLHLHMELLGLEPDRARLRLPFTEEVVTIGDTVHGGAIGSLIDTAAMAASWSTDDAPSNLRGTTVGLTVQFVTAARASDLTAEARVVHRGRSLCSCDVEVTDAAGRLVAKGLVTYKLG